MTMRFRMRSWTRGPSHPEFQSLISNAMARQLGLDRQMIGFNGTHYSENSDRTTCTRYCRIAVLAGCKNPQ